MAGFIENFYYGKADPHKRHPKNKQQAENKIASLTAIEEYLFQRLEGKEGEYFLKYVDLWREIQDDNDLETFIAGFRMGSKFTYDTFVSEK
ncbi:MAG: hypothetical protein IKA63_05445 [Clostridia bacterium]|nr:hypothetical protein [Clostridia bacterium]